MWHIVKGKIRKRTDPEKITQILELGKKKKGFRADINNVTKNKKENLGIIGKQLGNSEEK